MNLGTKLFLFVVRHKQIHLFDPVHLYECGQAHLNIDPALWKD